MFEKLIEAMERIATALERIAAYAGNPTSKPNVAADKSAPAGKAGKETAGTKSPLSGRPSSESKAEAPADDGLGGDDAPVTFENMRAKLVEVKSHPKLGPTKSSAILAKYGKLDAIKESDFAKVAAECDKLLKPVGA